MQNQFDPRTTSSAYDPAVRVGVPSVTRDAGLRSYMLKVYNYMASGVLLTGIIAMLFAESGYAAQVFQGGGLLPWVIILSPLAIVFAMSFGANRMSSATLQLLMLELAQWAAFGPWRSSKLARKPVRAFAGDRLDRLWSSISDAGRHLADLSEDDRHELRIQVKKMRYAFEFLSGLYPSAKQAQERFGEAVEELQESLGKLNDLAVARTLVEAGAPDDDWLIGEPEERLHLREAERAYRDLAAVGPFWRMPFMAQPGG